MIICDGAACLTLGQVHLDKFFHHALTGLRCVFALLLRHMDYHALQCAVPATATATAAASVSAAMHGMTNDAAQVQLAHQSAPIIRNHMRALWGDCQGSGDLSGTKLFRYCFILVFMLMNTDKLHFGLERAV
jgi:hypothetical protein